MQIHLADDDVPESGTGDDGTHRYSDPEAGHVDVFDSHVPSVPAVSRVGVQVDARIIGVAGARPG
ncbi:hypothetical protein ACFYO6_33590 [Streptomyces anthocyanicus]|uniref:hypothetical protein n=1 Tax=Streptomyces anthocyanicus TaxID=68174 RepID=UPI0036CF7135